jgi:hypothetical protein
LLDWLRTRSLRDWIADAEKFEVFSFVVIMKLFQVRYELNSTIIPFWAWATCQTEAQQITDRLFRMAFEQISCPVECRILH